MATQEEMERFFGFSMTDPNQKKVEAVKKKMKKVEKLEKKESKTPEQQREIDFFEKLGMSPAITNNPDWKKKQKAEQDQSLLETLKKMGVIG